MGVDETGYEPSLRRGAPVRIPRTLASNAEEEEYGYVVLGAGCAGLSFCYYLLEAGVEEPILVLDQKGGFADDRTWCFWDVEPTPFSHLAVKLWDSWSLHAEGATVVHHTDRYPYRCVTAADFYEHALEAIAARGNVTLRLGEAVEGYKAHGGRVYVSTDAATYTARHVLDARGLPPGSPVFDEARREAVWVPQKFLGLRLRTREPVFDPAVCTLMDFSVSQDRGLRFVYVLPFTGREALVENVYLSEARVSPEEHRAELAGYLVEKLALSPDAYVVDGEERGYIPMTDYRFPRRLGEGVYTVGMLGGETRPSTGYTFLRIQRYCRALAGYLAAGRKFSGNVHARRYEVLDAVFLRFMRRYPARCPGVYRRMFAGVPPDALIRFLTERSTPLDELRLVGAMPKMPFLGVAARSFLGTRRPNG